MKRAADFKSGMISRLKQLRELSAETPGDELLNHGANILVRGLSLVARLLLILLLALPWPREIRRFHSDSDDRYRGDSDAGL